VTVDLSTRYLGLELSSPLVPSASPLGADLDTLRRLEEAGAAAVVLPSLFEEAIEQEATRSQRLAELRSGTFVEATFGYFPEVGDYRTGPQAYLEHLQAAKAALSIPVIASLNGDSTGGWIRYAALLEQAGADAIELNVYLLATDPEATAAEVEQRYLDLVAAVRETVRVPLAVKIGPYFSSMANMARRLVDAGADGLVLFNRFYQPDIGLEERDVSPTVELSTPAEVRLPLRWIAILRGRVDASLAATGGVHSAREVLKLLLVGADVTMMASALLHHGAAHLASVLQETRTWLEENEYDSVEQLKGSLSHEHSPDPAAFERSNYVKVLASWGRAPS
jgi:dihydroorotate dehydrogenase (fumarate)